MKDFVVGAQLYSVRKFMQNRPYIEATLKAIREMGYTTVQLSGQNRAIEDEFYADLLEKYGLKCVVTHNSLADFEDGFDALVKRHKTWKCKYAGLGAMPGEYHQDAEGFKHFALKANEIGKKLKDEGLVFVYHNHAFEFARYNGALGMDVLFDNFGDNVQFELDTYWAQAGGADPVQWIRKVDGRMEVMHFKDMVGVNGFNPHCEMVPIGCGNLNWAAIKQACEETHVLFSEVEQDNASDKPDALGEMATSAKFLLANGFTL